MSSGRRLYIRAPGLTREELQDVFSKFGEVQDINALADYSFVQYINVDDATKAQKEMDGQSIGDKRLTIEFARDKRQNRSNETCFTCNRAGHIAR